MPYERRERLPDADTFLELREAAGMSSRSITAIRSALRNSLYGVTIHETTTGEIVGMGRVVGDGGCIFHICDLVVHPAHQGQGLGSQLMDAIMGYIDEHAPTSAYVNLLADVDGFYEQWGFEHTAPTSKGMYLPR